MIGNRDAELPDTSQWQPRTNAADSLKTAFAKRCAYAERLMLLKATAEREFNVDAYDSGPGLEDIVRDEFSRLLPKRYSVRAGVINDAVGRTAGDFDCVIYNDLWFPLVKPGATEASRRIHMPIDGVYGVAEVKQTIDIPAFDAAMRKLVACHRLARPRTYARRIVENRESGHCIHGLSNPLYSIVLAAGLSSGVTLDDIANRFFALNSSLKRLEVVRAVCILGHGCITWGWRDDEKRWNRPALFMMEDLYVPIVPVKFSAEEGVGALLPLLVDLLLALFHTVLAPEDVAASYAYASLPGVQVPSTLEYSLSPDPEWLSLLESPCSEGHGPTI